MCLYDRFTFEGDVCVDIDECATGDHVCQPTAVCVNKHMGTDEQNTAVTGYQVTTVLVSSAQC